MTLREEVEHLSESQEVLTDLMVRKKDTQRIAPKDCHRKILEEFEELEVQRAKEALALVQKKHKLIKWDCERERARTMQRLGASRASGPRSGGHDNSSCGSCAASLALHTDEAMSASSRTAHEVDETVLDCSGKGRRKEFGGALTWRVKWRSWR